MTRPIARPIAQRTGGRNPAAGAGSRQISTGEDRAPARSNYITGSRLQRMAADMTAVDWELLAFVASCRLVSGRQLSVRFWLADRDRDPARARAARRALKRLSAWRVLDQLPGRARGGLRGGSGTLIYRVGVAGARLLAIRGLHQKRLDAPGERYVAHTLACTEMVVRLHAADARGELEVIAVQHEPRSWRYFLGPMAARLVVRPDLFLRIGAGPLEDRWFVEIDLGTEHKSTIAAKAAGYLAHFRSGAEQHEHSVYPRVLWTTPDTVRTQQLRKVFGRQTAQLQSLFSVCRFDEAIDFLAREARS